MAEIIVVHLIITPQQNRQLFSVTLHNMLVYKISKYQTLNSWNY